jgi:hypothetical protein
MACVTRRLEDFQSLITRDFVVVGGAIRRRAPARRFLVPRIEPHLVPVRRVVLPSLRSVVSAHLSPAITNDLRGV